jgi:hypothetical protein
MTSFSPPGPREFPSGISCPGGSAACPTKGTFRTMPRRSSKVAKSWHMNHLTRFGTLGPHRAHSTVMNRLNTLRSSGPLRAVFRAVLVLGVCSMPAFGQGRPVPVKGKLIFPKSKLTLPPGFAPPAGMCRIWIEGVPADQQPAPTDCATAVRNRPLNGRVIFSDEKATSPKPSKKKSEDEPSL